MPWKWRPDVETFSERPKPASFLSREACSGWPGLPRRRPGAELSARIVAREPARGFANLGWHPSGKRGRDVPMRARRGVLLLDGREFLLSQLVRESHQGR